MPGKQLPKQEPSASKKENLERVSWDSIDWMEMKRQEVWSSLSTVIMFPTNQATHMKNGNRQLDLQQCKLKCLESSPRLLMLEKMLKSIHSFLHLCNVCFNHWREDIVFITFQEDSLSFVVWNDDWKNNESLPSFCPKANNWTHPLFSFFSFSSSWTKNIDLL